MTNAKLSAKTDLEKYLLSFYACLEVRMVCSRVRTVCAGHVEEPPFPEFARIIESLFFRRKNGFWLAKGNELLPVERKKNRSAPALQ